MARGIPDWLELVLVGSVFALVLTLWILAVLIWWTRQRTRQEKIHRQVEFLAQPLTQEGRFLRLWTQGGEASILVPGRTRHLSLGGRLEDLRRAAGLSVSVMHYLWILGLAGLALAAGIYVFSANPIIALLGPGVFWYLGWTYLQRRIVARVALFETQLVEALDLAARSLRAGHPLQGAFHLIAQEIPAPVGQVFHEVAQQQELGLGLDEALRKTAGESASPDLKLFATSVIIQLRSGGNLADMMERLALVIRERLRLARRVRVLTAQTQLSKQVLLMLPFLVFLMLNLVNPTFMKPLWQTPEGVRLLSLAGASLLVGSWLMNRLAVIRY